MAQRCVILTLCPCIVQERPFECEELGCDYKCAQKSSLVSHGAPHVAASVLENRPFLVLIFRADLKGLRWPVQRRHRAERNFACELCTYTAKTSGDLRAHVARHGRR